MLRLLISTAKSHLRRNRKLPLSPNQMKKISYIILYFFSKIISISDCLILRCQKDKSYKNIKQNMYCLKILFLLLNLSFLNISLARNPSIAILREKYKNLQLAQKSLQESIQKSIWKIQNQKVQGTGFFISPNQFVTNAHFITGSGLLKGNELKYNTTLKNNDSHTFKIKNIQNLSIAHDLAVLEIYGETVNYLNLGNDLSKKTKDLFTMGYPTGNFKVIKKITPSLIVQFLDIIHGNKSNYKFYICFVDYLDKLNGLSGSPLLNKKGEVVGIISLAGLDPLMDIAYINAIRVNHLKDLLDEENPTTNINEYIENDVARLHKIPEEDIKEYIEWAERESPVIITENYNLGLIYYNGIGVPKDIKKANAYFKQSIKHYPNFFFIDSFNF